MPVSIPAFSREDATRQPCGCPQAQIVSIHASSREDATGSRRLILSNLSFNPRVLAGGRDGEFEDSALVWRVSIHASSREDATQDAIKSTIDWLFQSTRPRGRTRRGGSAPFFCGARFNPRVLAGGRDRRESRTRFGTPVSIHASSREDATAGS